MKLKGIKFKSIAFRWLINTFLLVVAVVILVGVIVSAIYSSLCVERVRSLCDDYSYEFSALKNTTSETFEDMAFALVDSFAYKTKLEVQVLDNNGRILVSTTAFQTYGETPIDYENAKTAKDGVATFRGENSGGESIFASTTLIKNNKATLPTSVNVGTIDIYYSIAKALRERYYDAKIDVEKIQDYLDKGFYYKGEKQDITFAINTTKVLFKQIYDELKINYSIETEAVVVMGGGAKILGSAFKKNIPGIIIMENIDRDIFSNATGYKMLMK